MQFNSCNILNLQGLTRSTAKRSRTKPIWGNSSTWAMQMGRMVFGA